MTPPDFSYFEQFTNFEKKNGSLRDFRIEGMLSLLDDFQNPHEGICFVHVAGSKGKGSTAAFTAALLADSLRKPVGIYSSPHVYDYRERIRSALPGMSNYREGFFSEELYSRGIERIRQYLERRRNAEPPTTFELLTLLALLLFRSRKLSWVVMEVGLGGRLDATNVIHPRLSIITPLEVEHSRYLGNTIAEIAREKSGIIKAGVPVLSQRQELRARQVIEKRARELAAPCHFYDELGEDLPETFSAALRQGAGYLEDNACLAYAAFRLLAESGIKPDSELHRLPPLLAAESINRTSLPARFERRLISSRRYPGFHKEVFLDAAHTPSSLSAFLSGLESVRKKQPEKTVTAIFSALEDKDHSGMLKRLIPACDDLIITGCGSFKRCNVDELIRIAHRLRESISGARLSVIVDPVTAFYNMIDSEKNDIIIVCGSFYLLGEIYRTVDAVEGGDASHEPQLERN